MTSKKPYHYSKKARRYIPSNKRDNRSFYYDYLCKLAGSNGFNPHTTYGKHVMGKLLPALREHRQLKSTILQQEADYKEAENNFDSYINQRKVEITRNYNNAIHNIATDLAYSNHYYLHIIKHFPFVAILLLVPLLIYYKVVLLLSVFLIGVSYVLISHLCDLIKSKYVQFYLEKATKAYSGNTPTLLINEAITLYKDKLVRLDNKLSADKNSIKIFENQLSQTASNLLDQKWLEFVLSEDFYTSTDWISIRDTVLSKNNNKVCAYCGCTQDLTVDHIRPRSKYPHLALDLNNTQILCRSCNSSKGNRINYDFHTMY